MYYWINLGCWPQAIILFQDAAKYLHDSLVEVTAQHDVRSGPDVRVVRMSLYIHSASPTVKKISARKLSDL
jgi:hypothetical protein